MLKNNRYLMLIDIENLVQIEKSLNKKYSLIFNLCIKCGLTLTHLKALTPDHLLQISNAPILRLTGYYKTKYISCSPELFKSLKSYIAEKKIKHCQKIFPLSRQAIWQVLKARGLNPRILKSIYRLTSTSRVIKADPAIRNKPGNFF
jgi:hypothetical protein